MKVDRSRLVLGHLLRSFISPKNNSNYHDDSGYTGLDSTPRPYKRRIQRDVKRPRVNNTSLPLHNLSMVQVIHFIVVIVVAASLCFGILVGTMDRERSNMKYQAIKFGSERRGESL